MLTYLLIKMSSTETGDLIFLNIEAHHSVVESVHQCIVSAPRDPGRQVRFTDVVRGTAEVDLREVD